MYSLPGVTIGFVNENATYSVKEGLAVRVCARIQSGELEIDAIVTLSSSNDEAEGRYITCTAMTCHLKLLTSLYLAASCMTRNMSCSFMQLLETSLQLHRTSHSLQMKLPSAGL